MIYAGFEAIKDDKCQVLWALMPISLGLLAIYLWIHVKIYFDQLQKASRTSISKRQVAPQTQKPVSITVLAPSPLDYDKKFQFFDTSSPSAKNDTSRPMAPIIQYATPEGTN